MGLHYRINYSQKCKIVINYDINIHIVIDIIWVNFYNIKVSLTFKQISNCVNLGPKFKDVKYEAREWNERQDCYNDVSKILNK